MTYRDRKLLDLAHECPCQADFEHDCLSRWPRDDGKYNTVPAHTNQLMFGRGSFHKAPDPFFAAVCQPAHDVIDGRVGGLDKETKHNHWLRAYIKTQIYIWTHGLVKVA